MSTDLLVIIDDDSDAYLFGTWIPFPFPQWYKATSHFSRTVPFTFTFNGTSAAFIGISPSPAPFAVQIDNGSSLIQVVDPDPPTYKQWFTTPTLPDGRHTITIANTVGASVDYAVVKVGTQTSLTGQIVIVDDDSSLIQYSGQWPRNTTKFVPGTLDSYFRTGYPYGNATHRSSNPGDTFIFRFSGTSIAVYGIFSWNNIGSLSATYSIDGTPHLFSISVTTSSPDYLNRTGDVSNHLYFSLDSLPPGPHTLLVNITEAKNHTFALDYITYKPAFDTLSSMPLLSLGVSGTNVLSSSTASGSQQSVSTATKQSVSTGALVGGVLGGVAFGVLVMILVLILRRRRARRQRLAYADAALRHSGDLNDPNMLNPYAANSFHTQGHQ